VSESITILLKPSALDGGQWWGSQPSFFTPVLRAPLSTGQEVGWTLGLA